MGKNKGNKHKGNYNKNSSKSEQRKERQKEKRDELVNKKFNLEKNCWTKHVKSKKNSLNPNNLLVCGSSIKIRFKD